jgi:acetyl-CoA carboxylase biotin carboxyl carrier protein
MNQKEIRELIQFLKEQDIAEFELERGDVKVRIKRVVPATHAEARFIPVSTATPAIAEGATGSPQPGAASLVQGAAPGSPPEEPLHAVRSPIVGTFYEAPSPGAPPFAKIGDSVEVGQVLCIVEAMKLMNEIESDVAGEIVKKLVSNGQPIEYGQELFAIRSK